MCRRVSPNRGAWLNVTSVRAIYYVIHLTLSVKINGKWKKGRIITAPGGCPPSSASATSSRLRGGACFSGRIFQEKAVGRSPGGLFRVFRFCQQNKCIVQRLALSNWQVLQQETFPISFLCLRKRKQGLGKVKKPQTRNTLGGKCVPLLMHRKSNAS